MSRLRRPILHLRFLFVTTNLLRNRPPFRDCELDILALTLGGIRERLPFSLCGYCLLRDHVHAIVLPHEETTISDVMKRFKLATFQRLRAARFRSKPFWQSRFYDHALRTRSAFDEALDYMHMNPVRKGFVENPLAWKWSSARWLAESTGAIEIDCLRLPFDAKERI